MEDKFVQKVTKRRDSWSGDGGGDLVDSKGVFLKITNFILKSKRLTSAIIITTFILLVGLPSYKLYHRFIPQVTKIAYLDLNLLALPDSGIKAIIKMPLAAGKVNEGLGFILESSRAHFPNTKPVQFSYKDLKGSICGKEAKIIQEKFLDQEIIVIRPEQELSMCDDLSGKIEFTAYGPVYDFGLERRLKLMVIPERVRIDIDKILVNLSFTGPVSQIKPKLDLATVKGTKSEEISVIRSNPAVNMISAEFNHVSAHETGLVIEANWK